MSSSIVISFSIAILLLVALLLLISYNSKCKMDNVERFENDVPNIKNIFASERRQPINSDAALDTPNLAAADGSQPLGNIYAADSSSIEYSTTTGEDSMNNNINSYADINGPSPNLSNISGNSAPKNTCLTRDRLTSSDLLPKDAANSKWAQINPAGSGMLGDQNFLTASYHVGINTDGQSLRNANLQLRSEPPNPQVAVSPWGISTIEPDVRAVAFEIGSAPSF